MAAAEVYRLLVASVLLLLSASSLHELEEAVEVLGGALVGLEAALVGMEDLLVGNVLLDLVENESLKDFEDARADRYSAQSS